MVRDSAYRRRRLVLVLSNEQPFTRTKEGVEIDDGVDEVTVEGHDLANGYGGETMTVPLPDR